MFTVIIVMILGMFVGYVLRERQRLAKHIDTIVTWAIFILLFLLGISVGTNKTILGNIDTIFLQVIILTLGAVMGSVVIAYFTYRFFFKKYED